MKVVLASDHAGYEMKEKLKEFLKEEGYEVTDKGAYEYDKTDDYPDFIIPAAEKVAEEPDTLGVVLGRSGQGEALAANKVKGVRAVLFYGPRKAEGAVDVSGEESEDPYEMLRLTREHNHSNVLSLGSAFLTEEMAKKAVKAWLETPQRQVPRHVRRINKVKEYEERR